MLKLRTLLALALLVVCGGLAAWRLTRPDPHVRTGSTKVAAPVVLQKDQIDELEITEPGKPALHVKKDGAAWKVLAPVADAADEQAITAALDTLVGIKWRDVVATSAESHEKLGLDAKQAVVVVVKGGGKPLATLHLGKGPQIRVNDDPRVYDTRDFRRWSLVREAKLWRHREIVRLEPEKVTGLTLVYPTGQVVLKKAADGKWAFAEGTKPMPPSFDAQAASDLTATLARVDAEQFVDAPVTDEVSGLGTPGITLTATTSDGKSATLLIGKSAGEAAYVKRPDGPRVWQVASYVIKRIPSSPLQWQDKSLAEIQPDQVVSLEVKKGAESAKVTREGDGWKAADGPADTEVVNAAVASFGRLRATGVVENGKGIAVTAGSIAVTTKDGKTTRLLLGAEKKEDRAYYAQLEGKPTIYLVPDYVVSPAWKTDFKGKPPGGM
jgi:Domain of unknown function (DUF4340)